jgi:hypothetical protein
MRHPANFVSVVTVLALTSVALGGTVTAEAGDTCGGAAVIQVPKTPYGHSVASDALSATRMRYCCVKSGEIGAGCCGQSAATVKAKYDEMRAANLALAAMHECCAAAVKAGQGCCGQDAASTEANFTAYFVDAGAQVTALDAMRPCCAAAVQAHQGCCGKDAADLSADFSQKVADARALQVIGADGC